MNCWEYMNCGCQPSGDKAAELCECPATVVGEYTDGRYNRGTCLGCQSFGIGFSVWSCNPTHSPALCVFLIPLNPQLVQR